MKQHALRASIAIIVLLSVGMSGCDAKPSQGTLSPSASTTASASSTASSTAPPTALPTAFDGAVFVVWESRQCYGDNGLAPAAVDTALRRGGIRSFELRGTDNIERPVCQGCWPSCSINHSYRIHLPQADAAKAQKIVGGLIQHAGGEGVTPNHGGKTVEVTLMASAKCTAAVCGPKKRCCNACGFDSWTIPTPDYATAEVAPGTPPLPSCTVDGCGQCAFDIRASGSLVAHQKFVVSKWTRRTR